MGKVKTTVCGSGLSYEQETEAHGRIGQLYQDRCGLAWVLLLAWAQRRWPHSRRGGLSASAAGGGRGIVTVIGAGSRFFDG